MRRGCVTAITPVFEYTLIRGAGAARIQVTNADTGEVYLERQIGELYPAYYNPGYGQWENTVQYASLNWSGMDASGEPLAEDTRVNVSLTAVPHYYRQSDGSFSFEGLGEGATMTTSLTIDNTAPEVLDIDVSRIDDDKLTIKAKDNRHVAAVALLNANGSKFLSVKSPNQTERNQEVTVELDLTDIYGKNFLVAVYDYADNITTCPGRWRPCRWSCCRRSHRLRPGNSCRKCRSDPAPR